ncbi:hypothetical protein KJ966_03390 [bacterium]|nr:hypothetical protein [bacterium]
MKALCLLFAILLFCFPLGAQDTLIPDDTELEFEDESFESEGLDETELVFEDENMGELLLEDETATTPFLSSLLEPIRFTLRHEVSYKTEDPDGINNNRTSFRLEYSKFFLNNFFLQFDSKLSAFWSNDHRAEAENEEALFETSSKEAFLQASFSDTSIKAGVQILIWGESDGGAITDVISPRDYSELFFISLEESRIGQPIVIIDQFSTIGDWSFFFIPDPGFNEYPEKGTAYYYDPFAGLAVYQDVTSDEELFEYGLRWKKTFGKSDVGIMAASLIDNDYAYRLDGYTNSGKLLFTKIKQRYTMAGITFNYATGNFLLKGEIGKKLPKAFNNGAYQIIEKDVVDTALGLEYSPGGDYTLSLEAVNNHVIDWNDDIQTVPEDSNSLVVVWSKSFFNEDLSVNWMTSYSEPYTSYMHSLRTSYNWNDNITLFFDAFYPDIKKEESNMWVYRDQKQLVFKLQFQF